MELKRGEQWSIVVDTSSRSSWSTCNTGMNEHWIHEKVGAFDWVPCGTAGVQSIVFAWVVVMVVRGTVHATNTFQGEIGELQGFCQPSGPSTKHCSSKMPRLFGYCLCTFQPQLLVLGFASNFVCQTFELVAPNNRNFP